MSGLPPAGLAVVSSDAPGDPQAAAESPHSLRSRTVSGFAWLVVTLVTNKFVGFAAQLVTARWLTKEDFGLIGLALAASAFVLLIRESGVTQVLVQRGDAFDRWAGPGLGLVTVLSVAAGLLLAGLAGPLAHAYAEPRLVPILRVLALCCPLAGLANVGVAKLEHSLRFAELGLITTATTLVQYGGQVILVLCGVGAISFAWGILAGTVLRLAWVWALCRPSAANFFSLPAWRALLGDSLWILGAGLFATVVAQYDRVVLAKFADLQTVGVYFFAFNLTTQTSQLLSTTLGGVLFPALSRLADRPQRQREVFLESARLLACVAIPLCGLQAVLARPIVKLFGPQWDAAVPVVQILSVGMAMGVCTAPAVALLQSQGRFRVQFLAQGAFTLFYFVIVSAAAATFGTGPAVAAAVAGYFLVVGPVGVQLATRAARPPWRESAAVFSPGVVIATGGLLAVSAAWTLGGRAWPIPATAYALTAAGLLAGIYPYERRAVGGLARSLVSTLKPGRAVAVGSVPGDASVDRTAGRSAGEGFGL